LKIKGNTLSRREGQTTTTHHSPLIKNFSSQNRKIYNKICVCDQRQSAHCFDQKRTKKKKNKFFKEENFNYSMIKVNIF